jgi:hypothetical protein
MYATTNDERKRNLLSYVKYAAPADALDALNFYDAHPEAQVLRHPVWPSMHIASDWMPWSDAMSDLSLCGCCFYTEAVTSDFVWQCADGRSRWKLYPAAELGWNVQRKFDHPISQCRGNCTFHPLRLAEYPGGAMKGHGGWRLFADGKEVGATNFFADFVELCHEEAAAAETAEKRALRLAREQAKLAAQALDDEVAERERYAADVKQRAMRGVRKGEAPKILETPCKWVIGEFYGEECWAWEYTDPKTGKRMCPHTCNRLHPGQQGWHDEWFRNRNWKPAPPPPNRFAAALAPQQRTAAPQQRTAAPQQRTAAPQQRTAAPQRAAGGRWAALAESDSEEDNTAW